LELKNYPPPLVVREKNFKQKNFNCKRFDSSDEDNDEIIADQEQLGDLSNIQNLLLPKINVQRFKLNKKKG